MDARPTTSRRERPPRPQPVAWTSACGYRSSMRRSGVAPMQRVCLASPDTSRRTRPRHRRASMPAGATVTPRLPDLNQGASCTQLIGPAARATAPDAPGLPVGSGFAKIGSFCDGAHEALVTISFHGESRLSTRWTSMSTTCSERWLAACLERLERGHVLFSGTDCSNWETRRRRDPDAAGVGLRRQRSRRPPAAPPPVEQTAQNTHEICTSESRSRPALSIIASVHVHV